MPVFEFSVVVSDLDLENDECHDYLASLEYEVLPSQSLGQVRLDVVMDVPIATQAIPRLAHDLEPLGASITRAGLDLVTISEIAVRAEVSRETARLWAANKRRGDFPKPLELASQKPLWAWSDVYTWLQTHEKVSDTYQNQPLPVRVVEVCNGNRAATSLQGSGWSRPQNLPVDKLVHRADHLLVVGLSSSHKDDWALA